MNNSTIYYATQSYVIYTKNILCDVNAVLSSSILISTNYHEWTRVDDIATVSGHCINANGNLWPGSIPSVI